MRRPAVVDLKNSGSSPLERRPPQVPMSQFNLKAAAPEPAGKAVSHRRRPVTAPDTAHSDHDRAPGRSAIEGAHSPHRGPQQRPDTCGPQHRTAHRPILGGHVPQRRIDVRITEVLPQVEDQVSLGGR